VILRRNLKNVLLFSEQAKKVPLYVSSGQRMHPHHTTFLPGYPAQEHKKYSQNFKTPTNMS
jgi:hypothetical protein